MTTSPLLQFISQLEAVGELSRISVTVNPALEIAAVTDRICKRPRGGKALLFERPADCCFPVATNLFGSPARVCRALGIDDLGGLTARLSALLDRIPEFDITALDHQLATLPEFKRFAPYPETEPETALIRMTPPDLNRFPFLQSWSGDGSADGHARYITLPQVFTVDPDGGTHNCGVYRVQLRGEREAAIQWKSGSGAARHAELYRRAGKAMPVAIVLGGDPAILFSAMFPLPGNLDEMTFAGFLRGAPLVTNPCLNVPLRVPNGAEVVIEGYVEPDESVTEGPFGNHTGFYSPAAPAALIQITSVSHRKNAIIPATVVGPPPMEDCWMAQAWERLLLALLQKMIPEISDISFPFEWVFHQSVIISLENPQPGMVRNSAPLLWTLPWFASARILLFVSADTEAIKLPRAAWRAINAAEITDDIIHDKTTGRVAIDATGCRLNRPETTISAESAALIARRWQEYGVA
jgi:4-hydroxy-3-polyprenylbenzoate decarboxylase